MNKLFKDKKELQTTVEHNRKIVKEKKSMLPISINDMALLMCYQFPISVFKIYPSYEIYLPVDQLKTSKVEATKYIQDLWSEKDIFDQNEYSKNFIKAQGICEAMVPVTDKLI